MRILAISAQKPDSTGSGVYLAQLARCFVARGYEVTIIAGVDATEEPELPQGVTFHPVRYDTPELPFPVLGMSDVMPYESTRYRDLTPPMVDAFDAAFTQAIRTEVDRGRPDLIIVNHLYLLASLVTSLDLGCPVVGLCHGTDLRQLKSHDLLRERIIEGVRALDHVTALHAAQKDDIMAMFGFPASRVSVLGTGYDASVFNPVATRVDDTITGEGGPHAEDGATDNGEDHGVAGTPPTDGRVARLVFVGKVCLSKGVLSLVRCLAQVRPPRGGLELTLVGGHSDEGEYDLIRRAAQDSPFPVRFAGRVNTEELVGAYRTADVFVLPSFFEGLPLVMVEALACGCEVVVTDLPGVRDWVEATLPQAPVSFIDLPRMETVDSPVPEDLPTFEARLAAAITDRVDHALGTTGAPYDCASKASWEAVADKLLSTLEGR